VLGPSGSARRRSPRLRPLYRVVSWRSARAGSAGFVDHPNPQRGGRPTRSTLRSTTSHRVFFALRRRVLGVTAPRRWIAGHGSLRPPRDTRVARSRSGRRRVLSYMGRAARISTTRGTSAAPFFLLSPDWPGRHGRAGPPRRQEGVKSRRVVITDAFSAPRRRPARVPARLRTSTTPETSASLLPWTNGCCVRVLTLVCAFQSPARWRSRSHGGETGTITNGTCCSSTSPSPLGAGTVGW